MNKILIGIVLIMAIGLVSATDSLGTFKQNDCINLIQNCNNCSVVNITKLTYPNSTAAVTNIGMTADGTSFNYTFCQTPIVGTYFVSGFGDLDGVNTVWTYTFDITPLGDNSTSNIGFYFFIIVTLFILLTIGFYSGDKWIVILCGIGMLIFGLYFLVNGISGFRDSMLNTFISFAMIGIGTYISVKSSLDIINE